THRRVHLVYHPLVRGDVQYGLVLVPVVGHAGDVHRRILVGRRRLVRRRGEHHHTNHRGQRHHHDDRADRQPRQSLPLGQRRRLPPAPTGQRRRFRRAALGRGGGRAAAPFGVLALGHHGYTGSRRT